MLFVTTPSSSTQLTVRFLTPLPQDALQVCQSPTCHNIIRIQIANLEGHDCISTVLLADTCMCGQHSANIGSLPCTVHQHVYTRHSRLSSLNRGFACSTAPAPRAPAAKSMCGLNPACPTRICRQQGSAIPAKCSPRRGLCCRCRSWQV